MRVTVLGASGGFPAPGTACSGFLVEGGGARLWLDAGSGTLARLLERCSLAQLDAVLVSHIHPDHWTDLPLAIHALRIGAGERAEPLPVFGPPGWPEAMGATISWALEDPRPVLSPLELREREPLELAGLSVEPILMTHSDVETFGFRISDGRVTVGYSADSGPCAALSTVAAEVDLFICEAGAPGTRESALHLNAGQAGEIAARSRARRLLLTHLRPGDDPERAAAAAASSFDGPVEVAREGASIVVSATEA